MSDEQSYRDEDNEDVHSRMMNSHGGNKVLLTLSSSWNPNEPFDL